MTELVGMLHQRGEALAGGWQRPAAAATAELADFLMLQAINRYEPLFAHFDRTAACIPKSSTARWWKRQGELATFTTPSERRPPFPTYRHDQLRESFEPVIAALRASLSAELEQRRDSDSDRGEEVRHQRGDRRRPDVLQQRGVRAGGPCRRAGRGTAAAFSQPAEGRRRSSRSAIWCNLALPGVPVQPMPVAPRQIPFHAGFVYFELDQASELWVQLKSSGGVALHVAGEFPGLAMEFWAIRG